MPLEEFYQGIVDTLRAFKTKDWKDTRACFSCEDHYPIKLAKVTAHYCPGCFAELAYGLVPDGTGNPHEPTRVLDIEARVRNQSILHLVEKSA